MTLGNDAKFEEKLICGLENDMATLENFRQITRKSQNWDFDGIHLWQKMYELKVCRGVMCHGNEE